VTADPDPRHHGSRPVRPAGHTDPVTADQVRPVSVRVSALDRVTLGLGVAVATVIALCSYCCATASLVMGAALPLVMGAGARAGWVWAWS
jgi:hypothetical protein